jgi:superfamily II DNA or RNA helicase
MPMGLDNETVKEMEEGCKAHLLINESDDYNAFYRTFISENMVRNNKIVKLVKDNPDKKILILTKLIEHGKMLANLTGGIHLHGETEKELRKQIMQDFQEGKNKILISTISLLSEGWDCVSLNFLINAGANKGDIKSIQMLGRILRKNEGKNIALFYDFIDDSRWFRKASNARMRVFKQEGYDVNVITM